MAYPVVYNVTYSYTGFQQAQGDNSFPGTQIDADLAGLQASVSNLALFTQSVLRSDGALNNGIVTFDSLSPALQTAGLAPAAPWVTATFYAVGKNAVINANLYRALVPHTSGVFATDLAAGYWLFVTALPVATTTMAANTIRGNNTGALASAIDLTGDQVEQMLLFKQTGAGAVQRTLDSKVKDYSTSVKDFTAAGSSSTTTGTIAAGSPNLTLAAALDFANGQGIRVNHAGAAFAVNPPTALTVTPTGAAGATNYTYTIASLDAAGGVGAAIANISTNTGNAALSGTNYNALAWTAPAGTPPAGYAVYGRVGGALALLTVVSSTSWNDVGNPAITPPTWLPATPPAAALADWLVTSILSGGGTTALILAANAVTTATAQFVAHDDGAAINSAISNAAVNQRVGVPNGTYVVTTKPTNPNGIGLDTAGEILLPDLRGGFQRLNSYADRHKVFIGKEYMFRAYQRIQLGQAGATGTLKAFIYGDSTVSGGNGEDAGFRVEQLLSRYFTERGIPNVSITNRGVSGTKITDMNAVPDLSTTTDLIIIKYGINDATVSLATRLSTYATGLRNQLAAIRANANGSVGLLSILLVGPNATTDSPNNRDERWYEQLRSIYLQAARDYNCAYFDTYGFLRDARPAGGLWMDNAYGNGIAIHPLDHMNSWIWGTIFDTFFGPSETRLYATNSFTNVGAISSTALAATTPSGYNLGLTIQRAIPGNGWPDDGAVETIRHVDGVTLQRLWPYAANRTRSYMRTANAGANTWNRWAGVYENLTLSNSWVNYGAPWPTAQACMDENGHVQIKGMIKGGTTTANTVIATVPAGMLPAESHLFTVATNGGTAQIRVTAGGTIEAHTSIDGTYTSLSQIRYYAA